MGFVELYTSLNTSVEGYDCSFVFEGLGLKP